VCQQDLLTSFLQEIYKNRRLKCASTAKFLILCSGRLELFSLALHSFNCIMVRQKGYLQQVTSNSNNPSILIVHVLYNSLSIILVIANNISL